uniref:Uncharacterized protein n=2 Tax=Hemiselmis andersenii TaxID=464988 RepID=A0A6U4MGK8_HEMAN|mmetsp:Transcript_34398/g.83722  ORF Transcript_34398/g.83722 Transcript_34398/m.83722 type:complete len:209 (+) Transcript_34398:142-768(+)
MAERDLVWVVLKREGVDENEVPTQVYCPVGRFFNIDTLKKAAKAEFGQLLAHVAAAQLSVSRSATRDDPAEDPRTLVSAIAPNPDVTLYIHAPAAPPQEQRRRKRIRKVQRVQTPEHITGSSAVPSYSTTLLSLFAWWLPVASRESSKEGLPQQCLSSALSSASHAGSSSQCTAISSKAYSAAENAPLLAAHTTGGCTRRNQHAFSGD